MSTAPRRVEDAVPAPAAARSKGKGKNPPAHKFWHQGFIVQTGPDGRARVPFLRESTAIAVANEATHHTKIPMTVEPWDGHWCYTPAAVPAQREEAPDA